MYEETDVHHHPYEYNFESSSGSKNKQVVIVWDKKQVGGGVGKSCSQSMHRTTSPSTTKSGGCQSSSQKNHESSCQSQKKHESSCQSSKQQALLLSDSEVFAREIRSSPSMSEETCTTASMNTISFDAWDDEEEDDDNSVVALNKIPDLTLSARVFSNDAGCSFYASSALTHDDGEDDVNSLTSDEEVEDAALRISRNEEMMRMSTKTRQSTRCKAIISSHLLYHHYAVQPLYHNICTYFY
jgi:hypothetical protein